MSLVTYQGALIMILRYSFWNFYIHVPVGGCAPQLNAISPNRFKDCLVQQQFIFDRRLRFAAEQPVLDTGTWYLVSVFCSIEFQVVFAWWIYAFFSSICDRAVNSIMELEMYSRFAAMSLRNGSRDRSRLIIMYHHVVWMHTVHSY